MSITNDVLTIAGNIGNDPISNETRARCDRYSWQHG